MLFSLFPDLFFLSPFAYTLLRVVVGSIFLLVAWNHYEKRRELGEIKFIVIGKGVWIPIFTAVAEAITGVGLIFGAFTQAAAILGAIIAAKFFIWKRSYSAMFPLSRSASALLFVVCLSLIVTGAGAFAFDLPL